MFKVTWKVRPEAIGPMDSTDLTPVPLAPEETNLFSDLRMVGQPEPVFSQPLVPLRAEVLALPGGFAEDPAHDLAGYCHAFVEDLESAQRLRERLLGEGNIESADIQTRPEVAFMLDETRHPQADLAAPMPAPTLNLLPTPNYQAHQGYLAPAPNGIDAFYAWGIPGGKGSGINIVDIEDGWNFQHEDLRQRQIGVVYGSASPDDHGTAVLGIYSGDDNGFGVTGIVPEAIASAASATYKQTLANPAGKWNAANAIQTMANALNPGDIILLEMHAPGPNAPGANAAQNGYIAIEYWMAEFAAIQYAVAKGIVVVEAAGNGGEDLDAAVYQGLFERAVRDSGAILVGGGASPNQAAPRSRLSWSNYGSRLDIQGWGEDIVTCGGQSRPLYYNLKNDPDPSRCYTESFGGTSGASPIIVGAAAAINGCLLSSGQAALSSAAMRQLLAATGTPQQDGPFGPATQQIGPLPDLRAALGALGF